MVAIVMNNLLIGQLLLNANLLRQAEMEMNHANISVN
jgi:hypothetical protein